MVSKIRRKEELDGGLDILTAEGLLLLVSDKFRRFKGDLLEHVGNKGVDDVHTLLADSDVVRDTSKDLVDIKREGLEVLSLLSGGLSVLLCGCFTSCHYYNFGADLVYIVEPDYLGFYWLIGHRKCCFRGLFIWV